MSNAARVTDGNSLPTTENVMGADARMYGRLGWHGQCACCCGKDEKRTERMREDETWRREIEYADECD